MIEWDRYEHFSEGEFVCRCGCGRADMDPDLLHRLQSLRYRFGGPLIISSGFRCPDHNERVSGTGRDGPHTTGKAVDIKIHGMKAWTLLAAAAGAFNGIGIAQKGKLSSRHTSRFIHLDTLEDRECRGAIRPMIWSY